VSRQRCNESRILGVVPQRLPQFLHSSVNAVFKVHEGIGWPDFLPDLFPRQHFAGSLDERRQYLEGPLLELYFVTVEPHFTASKINFELSDPESRRSCGWYLHCGLDQLFDFDLTVFKILELNLNACLKADQERQIRRSYASLPPIYPEFTHCAWIAAAA
jgi:hypothetical protein